MSTLNDETRRERVYPSIKQTRRRFEAFLSHSLRFFSHILIASLSTASFRSLLLADQSTIEQVPLRPCVTKIGLYSRNYKEHHVFSLFYSNLGL